MPESVMIRDYIDNPPGFIVSTPLPLPQVGLAYAALKFQYGCPVPEVKPKLKLLTRYQILKSEN
jgi:hypothetical protein